MSPPMADNGGAIARLEVWVAFDDVPDLGVTHTGLERDCKRLERAITDALTETPSLVTVEVRSVMRREHPSERNSAMKAHGGLYA
jgi:hypothetical protein